MNRELLRPWLAPFVLIVLSALAGAALAVGSTPGSLSRPIKHGDRGIAPLPEPSPSPAASVQVAPSAPAQLGGLKVLGDPRMVAYSGDLGVSWAAATGLPHDQPVDVAATDGDGATAYAYCAGGDFCKSSDSGKTWSFPSSSLRSP